MRNFIKTPYMLNKLFCLLFIALFMQINLHAGEEVYNTRVSTNSSSGSSSVLNNSSNLIVQDAQYIQYLQLLTGNSSTTWPLGFYDRSVKNRVIFGIDYGDNSYVSQSYTATVIYTITYQQFVSGSFQTITVPNNTLTVEYDPLNKNKDKSVYEFLGGNSLEIQVTNLYTNNTAVPINKARLQLEAEIDVERYFQFDPNTPYPFNKLSHCSNLLTTTGEIEVFWDPSPSVIQGAEEYELEWTFINNYSGTINSSTHLPIPYPDGTTMNIDNTVFEFNSTRISTTNNYYRIPYIYESGYILYRVRALGRNSLNGYTANIPGQWSQPTSNLTTVEAFPNRFPNNTLSTNYPGCNSNDGSFFSHVHNLNWQSSVSYAEEGKSKAVVSYYDGSLRNRQSVTKIKSSDEVIVGETVYDYQGRPAVQILPVPVSYTSTAQNRNLIEYKPNFNLTDGTNVPYTAAYFDQDGSGPCVSNISGLDSSIGAYNYYSSQNSNQANENAFIPDAKKYPFTQVEYTPDNTGRVRRQSGVGVDHKLDSQHETKYFYAAPMQKDLDRLFGSEAGDASHYKENMVVDANGQTSISYIDPQGKTVATSLAGNPPSNLSSISSTPPVITQYDLLNKVLVTDNSGLNNHLDIANEQVVMQENIAVPATGPYTYTYSVVPPQYSESCSATHTVQAGSPPNFTIQTISSPIQTICYDCVLDLKISMKDECGTELFTSIFPAGSNTATVGVIDSSCAVPTTFSASFTPNNPSNLSNIQYLTPGTYSIEKTLSVNQHALDVYTRNYLDTNQNSCALKFSDFFAQALGQLDFSGCNMDCNTCLTKLGSYDLYHTVVGTYTCTVCLSQAGYDSLKAECEEMCDNRSDKCASALMMLESDMSKGGQYAQYSKGGGVVSTSGMVSPPLPQAIQPWLFPLSVLNDGNSLPRKSAFATNYTSPVNHAFEWGGINYYTTNAYNWRPTWRNPYNPTILNTDSRRFQYLDEYGNTAYVILTPGQPTTSGYSPDIAPGYLTYTLTLPSGDIGIEPRYLYHVEDFINQWDPAWADALIAYHPEYELYKLCLNDTLSNNFDEQILEITTAANAKQTFSPTDNTFMFPLGIPSGVFPSITYSGPVLDPYFSSSIPPGVPGDGYTEINHMRDAMINYVSDGSGNYINIWDFAYRLVNCPDYDPSSVCPSCSLPVGAFTSYVFGDKEWQTFRSLYGSLKQSIQERIDIQYSISNTCYNECIGATTFDAFDNNFYAPQPITYPTTFWFGFPFVWNVWPPSGNTSPYFDFEQPCNWSQYLLYKDKQARFT